MVHSVLSRFFSISRFRVRVRVQSFSVLGLGFEDPVLFGFALFLYVFFFFFSVASFIAWIPIFLDASRNVGARLLFHGSAFVAVWLCCMESSAVLDMSDA